MLSAATRKVPYHCVARSACPHPSLLILRCSPSPSLMLCLSFRLSLSVVLRPSSSVMFSSSSIVLPSVAFPFRLHPWSPSCLSLVLFIFVLCFVTRPAPSSLLTRCVIPSQCSSTRLCAITPAVQPGSGCAENVKKVILLSFGL